MSTGILWLVVIVLIVTGLVRLLEPGVAFFIVLAVLPFVVVIFFVREQHVRLLRQCVGRYRQRMKCY